MARTEIPTSVDALQQLVAEQQVALAAKQVTIDEQTSLIGFLQEWKRLMASQRFGAKSERPLPDQGRRFLGRSLFVVRRCETYACSLEVAK